jgi:hypothetical protein
MHPLQHTLVDIGIFAIGASLGLAALLLQILSL